MATGWPGLVQHEGYQSFSCPEPLCYYKVALRNGNTADHTCPRSGKTTIGWTVTENLVVKLWDNLDAAIQEVQTKGDEYSKGVARAYCESIVVFMSPFYPDSDAVAREAMKRRKALAAGQPWEIRGIDSSHYLGPHWYPAQGGGYTSDFKQSKEFLDKQKPVIKHKLPDSDIASIKHGAASGMFTNEELAGMYKVSVDLIKDIVSG